MSSLSGFHPTYAVDVKRDMLLFVMIAPKLWMLAAHAQNITLTN